MVALICTSKIKQYWLFKSETYCQVIRAYLNRTKTEETKIILIYDISVGRTIYKAESYDKNYQELQSTIFRKIYKILSKTLKDYYYVTSECRKLEKEASRTG